MRARRSLWTGQPAEPTATDAIYGVGLNYDGWREPSTPAAHWKRLQPMVKEWFRITVPGGLIAIFQAYKYRHYFPEWFGPYGWTTNSELLVCKTFFNPRKHTGEMSKRFACPLMPATDIVVMLWKPGERRGRLPIDWTGRTRLNHISTNMKCDDPVARLHPCSKPVGLMEEIIRNWVMEGSSILDPMCGSGATCIAADRRGHPWMGVDISKHYCQLASKRLSWYREHAAMPDNGDWSTEEEFWGQLHKVFDFTIDGAASKDNTKLPRYWDRQADALAQDWSCERVWLNPPWEHRKIEPFLRKAKTAALCCAIVPATCLTTKYFKAVRPDYVAFPDRRIHFDPPTGPREKTHHALTGYPLLIYGALTDKQIVELESMRLTVFAGLPKSLIRG